MNKNNNESQRNIRAVTVGFLLIVFVLAIFSLKSCWQNKDQLENSSSPQSEKEYASISTENLFKKIQVEEGFIIFDLRSIDNFENTHIAGSENISLEELSGSIENLDQSKEYFFVDELGLTPQEKEALDILEENNLKGYYLEGGISAWNNSLLPLVSTGDPTSFVDQSKITYVQTEELQNMISQGEDLFIIDLRSRDQFNQGHIEKAYNIPTDYLESYRQKIPLGKKIVVYGEMEGESFLGAVKLFDLGFFNTYTLSGGLTAWKEKNYSLSNE